MFLINYFLVSTSTIKVYFLKDEKLIAVNRQIVENSSLLTAAKALTAGPTTDEKSKGIFTEIPAQAKILNISRQSDMAVVDFNSALESYGGGATRVQALIGQIVYSFTELPGISKVKITVEGADEVILGGEGFVIDKPLSRDDLNL